MRVRALLAAACAASLLVIAGPAGADGDNRGHGGHHDEAESEVDGLAVKVRPAVARAGNPVHVKAKFDGGELEVEDDEELEDESTEDETVEDDDSDLEAAGLKEDDEDDELEDDDELEAEDDDELEDEDEDSDEDDVPVAVTFTVDFGDGSAPEPMDVESDDDGEDDSDELESESDDDDELEADELDDDDELEDDDDSDEDKRRGHGHGHDKAVAHASHVYEADGDYEITVTATPEGGEAIESTVVVHVGRGSARMEGEDRVETALRISRDTFGDGEAGAVLLARADGFADALASATLALAEQAPVLLIPSDDVPDAVVEEIDRLLGGAGLVYLLGGEAAITPAVADELTTLGHTVERIAGEDRVATSVAVTQFLIDSGAVIDEVVLADAATFPDALSAAAYAAEVGAPVLLTDSEALSTAVHDVLMALGTDTVITVVGGTAAVSDAIVTELEGMGFTVNRLAGDDRYETSVEIAEHSHPVPAVIVIATGETFPDALAGGAYAGRLGAPLLLVGDELPQEVIDYLEANAERIQVVVVLGGGGAVPQEVVDQIHELLGL